MLKRNLKDAKNAWPKGKFRLEATRNLYSRMVSRCWYLARVQLLISKIVHVDLNQRTTKMFVDESNIAVDTFVSFLNNRKQQTKLKLRTFNFRLKTKQILSEQNRFT